MKLIQIIPATEDWISWGLVTSSGRYLGSVGVSFEHWEAKGKDRLLYFGPSTTGRRYIAILGWFILALPAVPMFLKKPL